MGDPRDSSIGKAITQASQPFNDAFQQSKDTFMNNAQQGVNALKNNVNGGLNNVNDEWQKAQGTPNDTAAGKDAARNAPIDADKSAQDWQAWNAIQQQRGLDQQNATTKKNTDYLNQQNTFTQNQNDEDAFSKARNAARVAKGNSLFGAWG